MAELLESSDNLSYLGEILAISSAFLWAFAIILFRISGRKVHPLGLNFFKALFSIPLFIATILITGQSIILKNLPWQSYTLLILSGIVGIGISDTLLFASLNRLGASLSAVINCLYSPFVIILSIVFLKEDMSYMQILGVILILSAILSISEIKHPQSLARKDLMTGIFLGILSMFSLAVGIVIIKPLLNTLPLLWATFFRTVAGTVFLLLIIAFYPERSFILSTTFSPKNWKAMIPGSFLGAYVSLIAWMGGMKYAQASVASALNQMNTVFIFILGVIFLKEETSKARIAALFISLAGALLVTFF